ncbi:NAD(P)/FAD-dependent oxidoreductase [Amycolatopsis rhabdoformis]|uniref:NAD(P)/FAD-dependent oxidoreductase n=1 Tax=Amycolatopsis rhabdoformis TaxID=1448059 RepID=A0ABZ1I2Z8_9PSEU|nr:NAD(P)/FAD-dependent oxidoreductase [Amycolatopsis rhabdoformis]WSE28203.1 NAD(P)/FAD-dependent oxidoreductase [Amycolatopsis rhabdoformis]
MSRVLIAGGGIAGTITAIALHEIGHEPVLFEAYDRTADGVGAFVTLAVNGLDALAPLGLKDLVKDLGFDTPKMTVGLGDGERLAEFPLGGPLPDGTVSQTVRRSDLYVALRDEAARRGVRTEYGRRLTDASQTSAEVTAVFGDGSTESGDLLIGADGLRSTVRRVLDPAAPAPRYVPLLNTGGFTTGVRLDDEPGVMHMVFGRKVFFAHVVHPDGSVWWFANVPRSAEPSPSTPVPGTAQWQAELVDLVRRDHTRAADIVRATEHIYTPWPTYDFPSVPVWHRGRIGIIGDAAHATSPAAGQGASMAIEDAVTLARCLRDVPVDAVLPTFESLRRARVEAVVAQGKRNGDDKSPGFFGRVVRDFFIRRAMRGAGGDDPNAFMWNHRIDWAAPVSA